MNPYATTDQLKQFADSRVVGQLSNDQNSRQGNPSNQQFLLDLQAGELEAALDGRYSIATLQALSQMPLVLTKWVLVTTHTRLWGRRSDRPKEIDADQKWADDWLKSLMDGVVGIPGIDRANQPALRDSDRTDGTSQFDRVFGLYPSPTGPSKGL